MKKILFYYPQLNVGGIENVMLNIIRLLDKSKYNIDILTQQKGKNEKSFIEENVNISYIPKDNNFKKNIKHFLKCNRYDVIHIHTCKEMGMILKISKQVGIKTRIAHSHNSRNDLKKIFYIYKILKSRIIEKNANVFLACSIDAAKWLFPIKYKKAIILKNGIDTLKFRFNKENRDFIRKQLKIDNNEFVIGMVSRISSEKNHIFIFDLIEDLLIQNPKIKLLVIGDGPLKNQLENLTIKKNLEKSIIFLGEKMDVYKYLSAFDLYILPSLYEGFPLSIIEAQYNGLYSITSLGIPQDADIGEHLFKRLELDKKIWISKIIEKSREINDHIIVKSTKYDIRTLKKTIEQIYN